MLSQKNPLWVGYAEYDKNCTNIFQQMSDRYSYTQKYEYCAENAHYTILQQITSLLNFPAAVQYNSADTGMCSYTMIDKDILFDYC